MSKVVEAYNFPPWALNTLQNTFNCKHIIHNGQTSTDNQPKNNKNSGSNKNSNKNISKVVPYIHGLEERFKRTCNSLGIHIHLKDKHHKNPPHGPKERDSKL